MRLAEKYNQHQRHFPDVCIVGGLNDISHFSRAVLKQAFDATPTEIFKCKRIVIVSSF